MICNIDIKLKKGEIKSKKLKAYYFTLNISSNIDQSNMKPNYLLMIELLDLKLKKSQYIDELELF